MILGVGGSFCAGKSTLVHHLLHHHSFQHLELLSDDETKNSQLSSVNVRRTPNTNATSEVNSEKLEALSVCSHEDSKIAETNSGLNPRVGTANQLMSFIMEAGRWRERWVVSSFTSVDQINLFSHRPLFVFVYVDAPLEMRFERFLLRQRGPSLIASTITDDIWRLFMRECDDGGASNGEMVLRANIHVFNCLPSVAEFVDSLATYQFDSVVRIRPSWDDYFMYLAELASRRSNCMKRRVGCIVVVDLRVVSTGYNGTPKGLTNCMEGGCGRCNDGSARKGELLDTCWCLHAEENALLEAGRLRCQRATLYCTLFPCLGCSKKIFNMGVIAVVYREEYHADESVHKLFKHVGVDLRRHTPFSRLHLTN